MDAGQDNRRHVLDRRALLASQDRGGERRSGGIFAAALEGRADTPGDNYPCGSDACPCWQAGLHPLVATVLRVGGSDICQRLAGIETAVAVVPDWQDRRPERAGVRAADAAGPADL